MFPQPSPKDEAWDDRGCGRVYHTKFLIGHHDFLSSYGAHYGPCHRWGWRDASVNTPKVIFLHIPAVSPIPAAVTTLAIPPISATLTIPTTPHIPATNFCNLSHSSNYCNPSNLSHPCNSVNLCNCGFFLSF